MSKFASSGRGFTLISLLRIRRRSCKGFTLIELLITITIIAVLSTIGVTVFSNAQKSARDAKRRGDVDAIAKALEMSKGSSLQYLPLSASNFSGGTIPSENGTNKYCINTDTSTSPGVPESWPEASACPASGWVEFGEGGLGGALPREKWTVCARLETSTADSGAGLQVDCRSSVQ